MLPLMTLGRLCNTKQYKQKFDSLGGRS
jgi:hypothetical protein